MFVVQYRSPDCLNEIFLEIARALELRCNPIVTLTSEDCHPSLLRLATTMKLLPKKLVAIALVLLLAMVGGMFARRAVKRAKAEEFVAKAIRCFERNDFQACSQHVCVAIQANPASVNASKLMAELLERSESPTALTWRIRACQLQPGNITNRLDWAQTAIKLRDLKSAEDALDGIDEQARLSSRYHKAAGALAWYQGKIEAAKQHYGQARNLEPNNPANLVNLAAIDLLSTNEANAAKARLCLEAVASTNGPYRLETLRRLAQSVARRNDLAAAADYAGRVATNKAATFADKLDYLNLLDANRSPETTNWLFVIKRDATNSAADIPVLGRWLSRNDSPSDALSWLSSLPLTVRTNQSIQLVIADCQVGVGDWNGLLATVEGKEWREQEILRLALESLARRSLGEKETAQVLWARARRHSARRLERLYALVQLAGDWRWTLERKDVLTEIVSEFPREKWAAKLLLAQLHDDGQTEPLEQLLSRLHHAEPTNIALKASLARVCLLRKSELDRAYQLAKEAFESTPNDPLVLSTYSYSLVLQGRQDEALAVIQALKATTLQAPWIAAWYGVIEAQSGNKKAARDALDRVGSARLLPEEIELVRQAKLAAN